MKGKSSNSGECMAGDGLNREPTMVPRMASASQSECVRYVLSFVGHFGVLLDLMIVAVIATPSTLLLNIFSLKWTMMDVFTFTGWRDDSSNWTLLRDLNESIWIKVAEYAVAHKILE